MLGHQVQSTNFQGQLGRLVYHASIGIPSNSVQFCSIILSLEGDKLDEQFISMLLDMVKYKHQI